ncbi:MAG: cell division protein FtsQ/DivIB [Bosea sp. (in: a-proteobacteria)]
MATLMGAGQSRHAEAAPQILGGHRSKRIFRFGRRSSVAVPLAQRLPRRIGTFLALGFLTAAAATGIVMGGHLDEMRDNLGEPRHFVARSVGLGIERVTISGIAELAEMEVLHEAGINPRGSLAFLDVSEARKALEANPLIREASVRKLYPSEVSINIVEREPYALWQLNGEISLISADGTVIDKMRDARFAHLPLVVGDQANLKARDYVALLAEAGPLKSRIRGATLVSGRRWTLKLENGLDVRLPETNAAAAMTRLVSLDRDHKLTERDVISVDLRQPDRVTLRLSEEAATARAEMLKAIPKKKGGTA